MQGVIKFQGIAIENDVPNQPCIACNKSARQDMMINAMLSVGSPGHPKLPPFQNNEIWACSVECWQQAGHYMIDMFAEKLRQDLKRIGDSSNAVS